MKKSIIALLFFNLLAVAQNDSPPSYSLSISGNYQLAVGNSYFNTSYANPLLFALSLQQNRAKNIFIGLTFNNSILRIEEQKYLGNFNSANSQYYGLFIGLRQYLFEKKFSVENSIGAGYKVINNKSDLGTYKIDGIPLIVGSKINKPLNKKIELFFKTEFIYFRNGVDVNGTYKAFYRDAYLIEPSFGIKFNF